jgi:cysteine-rich repeat protein
MRWLIGLALGLALVGCVDSELVECPDDRLCPRGTACDVVHHSCVAPDQLTACSGLPDLTSCMATGVGAGRCFDGVCLPAGCGNGFVEPPEEICDDGNTNSGDLCSADCRSKEVCGDGFADKLGGEECDDGNTRGRDGCTNRCTLERPVWHLHLQDRPIPRADAAAAYDSLAGNVVVFGGADDSGVILDDTWALDEVGWTTLYFGTPVRRISAAMAYDSRTRRVIMFGGYSSSTQGILLNDTWEWNGATWVRRTSELVPAARKGSALASDGTRVLMFGGSQISDFLQDTWSWNGNAWTRLTPAHSPRAREQHALVWDPKHARFVMFGGKLPTATNETWLFDGLDWTELVTSVAPPRMSWVALAYDAKREVVVLSGVESDTSANVVWELDASTWRQVVVTTTPNITGGAVLAYDERKQRVVQYGGRKPSVPMRNDVWEWNGTQWSLRGDPMLPAARQLCAIASDPVRGRVVLFGGQGATPLGDTWEWNGRGWQPMFGFGPSSRVGAGLAFDGTELVLFGGAGATMNEDTWRWNGQRWQQQQVLGPPRRYGHGMAYDSKRKRVLLFGGSNGSSYFNDTWQWDGSAWTPLTIATAPPPRALTQMAYDAVRDRIVVFGGVAADATTRLTDTWEFDGTTWTERTTTIVPEERGGYSLIYDRNRERVTLFGGLIASFSLWEWDGTLWKQPDTGIVPVATNSACTAYDDARGEIVAFGGTFLGLQQQTATGSYRGDREEVCRVGADLDEDGATGCDDDDCRMVCAPLCWDVVTCTQAPRCGDGACSTLESEAEAACPADCPL